MNDLHIKFKADTGDSAIVEIESLSMIEEIDTYPLREHTRADEVIDLIDSIDYEYAILVDDIPDKYVENKDVKLYRPEYVEWLEDQLKLKL
jgi:hypothetical protein